ncbi:hypothetical protein Godav_023504 [Gossypium davidsonii]|uniref:RNase H type-1 domain-containing protein n=1 Tax=Gossypium davidsonii TaxID=34287 RepID=A0A7J8SSR3_GOSDV|nr:hypothetical protein [Gossypium davidsonii]
MVKSGKIPGSRRKLCGRSLGSFKDHKGLGLLFGLLSSRGCSLIWKESDEVSAIARFLESCSMFEAELWGILDGLSILVDRGYDNILVQTDSLEVANAIKEGFTRGSNYSVVFSDSTLEYLPYP